MKAWKWDAPLAALGRGFEEHVHQHGLAAADRAPDIQAADDFAFPAPAEQTLDRA